MTEQKCPPPSLPTRIAEAKKRYNQILTSNPLPAYSGKTETFLWMQRDVYWVTPALREQLRLIATLEAELAASSDAKPAKSS